MIIFGEERHLFFSIKDLCKLSLLSKDFYQNTKSFIKPIKCKNHKVVVDERNLVYCERCNGYFKSCCTFECSMW